MGEKSSKVTLFCNTTVLILQFFLLFWIIAELKTNENVLHENNGDVEMFLSRKSDNWRAMQSERSGFSRSESTNDRTFQRLFDVWKASSLSRRRNISKKSSQKEQSFVQRILNNSNAKKIISRELSRPRRNSRQSTSENQLRRDPLYESFEITPARLWNANLTSSEKCRREGLEGSIACQFEYDHPKEAAKLYKLLQPLFTFEYEANQGAQRADDEFLSLLHKPFVTPAPENEEVVRKKRNIQTSEGSTRNKRSSSSRKREVCETNLLTTEMRRARHSRSGNVVSLYMFRGANLTDDVRDVQLYAPRFEIGSCASSTPTGIQSGSGNSPTCSVANANILVYFMIDIEDPVRGNYSACFNFNKTNIAVCRDFVRIPTLCKLYHTN